MVEGSRMNLLAEIVETCKKLKKSGEDLLRNYFHLGRLVDSLHRTGLSYRQIEDELRNKEPYTWIPRHTTLFSAHKFYCTVTNSFNGDLNRFLANYPDLTWKKLTHHVLMERKHENNNLPKCSTVEHQKTFINERPAANLLSKSIKSRSLIEAEETMTWLPRKPATIKGRPVYEILADREMWKAIPSKQLLKFLPIEHVSSKHSGPYLAVTLNPPYDYIKVLRCPNCLNILRAATAGAPVVCLECGYPNKI